MCPRYDELSSQLASLLFPYQLKANWGKKQENISHTTNESYKEHGTKAQNRTEDIMKYDKYTFMEVTKDTPMPMWHRALELKS